MPSLNHEYTVTPADESTYGENHVFRTLSKTSFDEFTSKALGLGDVSRDGTYVQALAAIFDLEGFTAFCNQVDSHLVVPEFLTRYLDWLFKTLAEKFKHSANDKHVVLWNDLPFFVKFLGDGLMFVWDTSPLPKGGPIANIVLACFEMTTEYRTEFLPQIRRHVSKAPIRLRCGMARGQIVSVGEDGDYVGSCINIAARLQKLAGLSFAVSRTGLDFSDASSHNPFWTSLALKRIELRGIGRSELVYVVSDEFDHLSPRDRKLFSEP